MFAETHCRKPSTPPPLPPLRWGPSRLSPFLVGLPLPPPLHPHDLDRPPVTGQSPPLALKLGEGRLRLTLFYLSTSRLIPISCLNNIQKQQTQLGPGRIESPRGWGEGGRGGQAEEPLPGVVERWGLAQGRGSALLPWRLAEQTPHLPLRHHVTGSPGWGWRAGQKSRNEAL